MRVDRPAAASNGLDRADSFTDGAATVLSLDDCKASAAEPFVFRKPGNPLSRLVRRMILEARNHVERENFYYWTFQAIVSAHNHVVQSNNQAGRPIN
jgi:hypothetical protein